MRAGGIADQFGSSINTRLKRDELVSFRRGGWVNRRLKRLQGMFITYLRVHGTVTVKEFKAELPTLNHCFVGE